MIKKLKGVIIVAILSLASVMMPFNIYAEGVMGDSPIIGVNITYTDYEYSKIPVQATVNFTDSQTRWQCMSSHSSMGCQAWQSQGTDGIVDDKITGTISYTTSGVVEAFLYEYDFVFDNDYVGYITFSNGNVGATTTSTYYVNGSHLVLTSTALITSFNITSYQLNAIPGNLSTWDFPIESFPIIAPAMAALEVSAFTQYEYYKFPFFTVQNGDEIFRTYGLTTRDYWMIFMINRNVYNLSQVSRFLTFNNCQVTQYSFLNRIIYDGQYTYILKLKVRPTVEGQIYVTSASSSDFLYAPIYWGQDGVTNISSDFALQFGLTNSFLDNIQLIAQGNSQSTQANTELNNSTSEFTSQSNDVISVENNITNGFESQVQNIDINTGLSGFGGNFMTSATWVRTQFNRLTENNPYGSLVAYGLTLGFALLMLGKVLL